MLPHKDSVSIGMALFALLPEEKSPPDTPLSEKPEEARFFAGMDAMADKLASDIITRINVHADPEIGEITLDT